MYLPDESQRVIAIIFEEIKQACWNKLLFLAVLHDLKSWLFLRSENIFCLELRIHLFVA